MFFIRKRRRTAAVVVAVLVALLVTSCGQSAPDPAAPGPNPGQTSPSDTPKGQSISLNLNPAGPGHPVTLNEAIASAQERFGLKLYKELLTEAEDGDNVFVSPLSIALALAMVYNGAAEETKAAMAEVLEVAGVDMETFNESYYALIKALQQETEDVRLNVANGIWQAAGYDFEKDFIERNRQYFDANLDTLDFSDPASVDKINSWIEEQTAGRIADMLSDLDPQTVMMLVNAIYFKGNWRQPFNPDVTTTDVFYSADGSTVDVPLMTQMDHFAYYKGDSFQAVRLPYGDEGELGMYVFLPDDSLADFHANLTPENWATWLTSFTEQEGTVSLPRFQIEFETSLRQSLANLGMEIAFDAGAADFSGIYAVTPSENLYIGDVLHRTFLLVNEEGSEAAAATGIDIRVTSVSPDPFSFVANRPFFLAIRDDATGSLLFAGSVFSPEPAEAP